MKASSCVILTAVNVLMGNKFCLVFFTIPVCLEVLSFDLRVFIYFRFSKRQVGIFRVV